MLSPPESRQHKFIKVNSLSKLKKESYLIYKQHNKPLSLDPNVSPNKPYPKWEQAPPSLLYAHAALMHFTLQVRSSKKKEI